MTPVNEGQLSFQFPDGWLVTHYDRWSFYRNQFQAACDGNKAVDLLALDPIDHTLWLIEVKDYRRHRREKELILWNEIALKVRDTLAGLVAANVNGFDPERDSARRALKARKLRVVLHLEQPAKQSKLFPRTFDTSVVKQKLRQLVKSVDAHPLVVEMNQMAGTPWTVS